jgi:hypothetical protein
VKAPPIDYIRIKKLHSSLEATMKTFHLVIALVIGTGFIVVLNLTYLRNIVIDSDLRQAAVDDRPRSSRPSLSKRATAPKPRKSSTPAGAVPVKPTAKDTSVKVDEQPDSHRVAGLNCDKYGGPSEEIAAEMVYWQDIPRDAEYTSPFAKYGKSPKYLTFEPDEGGWNNIRMSMETATVLAHAMGRILVLPPEQQMYLLSNDRNKKNNRFTFKDFFHFDSIADEHPSVEVISMEEFIQREAMTGHLKDKDTGKVTFPPNNETTWDGHGRTGRQYWLWLRSATVAPIWFFDNCVAAFPSEPGPEATERVKALRQTIRSPTTPDFIQEYFDNPTEVNAPPQARLREQLGTRREICLYDDDLQNEKVIHFMGDNASGARLLVHFYAFLFFENYHQDLWIKRFVRDHLRYIDEIQCAAARIVHAVRQKAIQNGDPDGNFDTFHIRRGDFQYKDTRISADQIYENTNDVLVENSTIFIATDEKDMSFFEPLRKHYNLLFLKDFTHLIEGLNTNYMGMLDQRIASRGRTFVGVYYSTFTGYINRMRGYHSQKDKMPGWEKGEINSYFYVPLGSKLEMRMYSGIKNPMWGREFPVGWRDIDHDLPPNAYNSA